MGKILAVVFQTIRRNLFLFLFILLILVSGKTIRTEWIQLQRIAIELPVLRSADSKVSEHQQAEKRRITQQLTKMSEATEQQLAEEIGVLDNEVPSGDYLTDRYGERNELYVKAICHRSSFVI